MASWIRPMLKNVQEQRFKTFGDLFKRYNY